MPPAPIRILHVLYRMDYGGVESWLLGLMKESDPALVQMDFLVHGAPGAHETEVLKHNGRIFRGEDPHKALRYRRRMTEVLQTEGPYDVVHAHLHLYNGLVMRIAARCGVPVRIAHSHSNPPPERGILRRVYSWTMRRWICRHATNGLAASTAALNNLFGSVADSRWHVLPCGIDMAAIRAPADREDLRRRLSIPTQARVIGHVGRLVAVKNHTFILRLAATMPDAWFLLIGDGELRQSLEKQARRLGIIQRIVFAGARDDVPALLHAMDVFVFPSLFEGLPLSVVEAQTAGLPVVMADTIPRDAIVVPAACTILALDAPLDTWSEALRTAQRPTGKWASLVDQSPFDRQRAFSRLMTFYRMKRD